MSAPAQVEKTPFFDIWLARLGSVERAKVQARITRVELGNFGDCESVGEGVHELRIDYGPGYRVYWTWKGARIVLLISGGDKSTQARDIKQAKQLASQLDAERKLQAKARVKGKAKAAGSRRK